MTQLSQANFRETLLRAGIPGLGYSRMRLKPDEEYIRRMLAEAEESYFGGSQHFEWEQAWGVSCTLRVTWNDVPRNNKKKEVYAAPKCDISWSSTGHDIASARCAITLFSAVADLAALIECHFRDRYVESLKAAGDRSLKESQARREEKLSEFKKTLKTGDSFNYDDPDSPVPREMEYHLHSCCANKSKDSGEKCGAPTKTITWSDGKQVFMPRCGRHKKAGLTEHDLNPEVEKAA